MTRSRPQRLCVHLVAPWSSGAELATPASERWIVRIDDAVNDLGYVHIALSDGRDAEARRGLVALLKRIAG